LLQRARARLSRLERLRAAAGRAFQAGSLSLCWEDVSLSLAPGSQRESDLAEDIFATVELAVAKGRDGLVLLLDEAQLIRDERERQELPRRATRTSSSCGDRSCGTPPTRRESVG